MPIRFATSGDIKKLIEGQKELGWEFIFLGANIDASFCEDYTPKNFLRCQSRGDKFSF